jgi:hypothetical protein
VNSFEVVCSGARAKPELAGDDPRYVAHMGLYVRKRT